MTSEGQQSQGDRIFDYTQFVKTLQQPQAFEVERLFEAKPNTFQVAGHSGILIAPNGRCLKPFNVNCTRGRREHLFYQLAKYFQSKNPSSLEPLYYKDFDLLIDPNKKCDCQIDPETFRSIRPFLPNFEYVKHLTTLGDSFLTDHELLDLYYEKIYSQAANCPCYGLDLQAKETCASRYKQDDYLSLEDLHVHCRQPCILDVKMGRITHDPMASSLKIEEQTNKYPKLRDYGFRLLGMKNGVSTRGKEFGKTLETQDQVFEAIESFFIPLESSHKKVVVIGRMLDYLERLLEWFETKNNNQLRFYCSSLLFVYDSSHARNNNGLLDPSTIDLIASTVRVKMIDFAHVFHSHELPGGPSRSGSGTSINTSGPLNKDDNYLYGLRRLVKFFIMLNRQYRVRFQKQQSE